MPYRAMFMTLLTVTLALAVAGMWVRKVEPMLATAQAATRAAGMPADTLPAGASTTNVSQPSDRALRQFIKGTLLLVFCLICLLLIVGFFATFREWVRYSTGRVTPAKKEKTEYVDAWKLAGERMNIKKNGEEQGPPPDAS